MDCMQLQKETKQSSGTTKYDQKKKHNRFKSDSDHILRKRQPPKSSRKNNDFYVTNKSSFKGQLAKCDKLLEGENEIVIHGLGAAVPRAINLALQLKDKHYGTLEVSVNTSTVGVVDDLEPANDSATFETQTHHKSSVHIRVFRTTLSDMK